MKYADDTFEEFDEQDDSEPLDKDTVVVLELMETA